MPAKQNKTCPACWPRVGVRYPELRPEPCKECGSLDWFFIMSKQDEQRRRRRWYWRLALQIVAVILGFLLLASLKWYGLFNGR